MVNLPVILEAFWQYLFGYDLLQSSFGFPLTAIIFDKFPFNNNLLLTPSHLANRPKHSILDPSPLQLTFKQSSAIY